MPRKCRECGCTDENACLNVAGETCTWAEYDLCTFCVDEECFDTQTDFVADQPLVELYTEGDLRRLTR